MPDWSFVLLLSAAAFAGSLVSGLAGFAFSAVAGAILLHVMPPVEAVPLMMACSLPVQCAAMLSCSRRAPWRASLLLIGGGLVGVIPAVWLLQRIDTGPFRIAFGLLVACYAAYMLLRPAAHPRPRSKRQDMLIGLGGGLIGGLTAMPGALPTIWCDMRGVPKHEQRACVQPFIVTMQVFALILLMSQNGLSSKILIDATLSVPALAAGTAAGLMLYTRLKDLTFRRVVLGTLLFSGLTLVF